MLLADEINRAPAKVQSALLEAMQERQVTIGDTTFPLPPPFLVLATQNPIEQEGTYPLPEAQVDRFMLKVKVGYPTREEEKVIMDRMSGGKPPAGSEGHRPAEYLVRAREIVTHIYMDEKVKDYILNVVFATREPRALRPQGPGGLHRVRRQPARHHRAEPGRPGPRLPAPPRLRHARGRQGRGLDVLRHRITLTYEAEAEELTAEKIIQRIFERVEVP